MRLWEVNVMGDITNLTVEESQIWRDGRSTGLKNVGEGLIDLVNLSINPMMAPTELLLGEVPNPLRNSTEGAPGGTESRWMANLGLNCLTAAATGPKVNFWPVKNGIGGLRLRVHDQGLIRVEVQEWHRGQPKWKYPHWHIPADDPRNLPWESKFRPFNGWRK